MASAVQHGKILHYQYDDGGSSGRNVDAWRAAVEAARSRRPLVPSGREVGRRLGGFLTYTLRGGCCCAWDPDRDVDISIVCIAKRAREAAEEAEG